jgi:ABC-type phosphate transport system ATPase subunit
MTLPKPPNPLSVKIDNLTATVDKKCQVHQVSVEVPAGKALSITGPVGSGKSALLWAINGLLLEVPGAQVTGSIEVGGVNTTKLSTSELRTRVGLQIATTLARTPFAEVALPLSRQLTNEAGDRVERVLRLVGLWRQLRDCLHKPFTFHDPVLLTIDSGTDNGAGTRAAITR